MLKSLKIENFRCFRSFEMSRLGRVNLLVGANNSGKTSVLEAIGLLKAGADLTLLHEFMTYRGEYSDVYISREEWARPERAYDICHLFYKRQIEPGRQFSIEMLQEESRQDSICFSIELSDRRDSGSPNYRPESEIGRYSLCLQESGNKKRLLPLSASDRLTYRSISQFLGVAYQLSQFFSNEPEDNVQFLAPFSLDFINLIDLFDRVVLTPEESLIIESLNIIDPDIKRIASVGAEKYGSSSRSFKIGERVGFKVLMSDSKKPIPIGSMGDGIWRMLALSLSLVCAKDGVLLVDEIDSGLHYSTMYDMWKMIYKTAERLNIDVFATTHNSDCWTSLAEVVRDLEIDDNSVTIHRIERDKPGSIVYTQDEIVAAADMDLEVR